MWTLVWYGTKQKIVFVHGLKVTLSKVWSDLEPIWSQVQWNWEFFFFDVFQEFYFTELKTKLIPPGIFLGSLSHKLLFQIEIEGGWNNDLFH